MDFKLSPADLWSASGLFAVLVAAGGFLGREWTRYKLNSREQVHKLELDLKSKEAEAVIESLKADHVAEIARLQSVHDSALRRAEEAHRSALEFGRGIDTDLRVRRIEAYKTLWSGMRLLPKWPPETVTVHRLRQYSKELRTWYFDGGGMYLSETSREKYGEVQDRVQEIEGDENRTLTPVEYESVRTTLSALRTELTADILSRKSAPAAEPAPQVRAAGA